MYLKRTLYYAISFLLIIGSLSLVNAKTEEQESSQNKQNKHTSNYFNNKRISDGPYLFIENGKTKVQWVSNNVLIKKTIRRDNYKIIERKFGFEFNTEWLKDIEEDPDYTQTYSGVNNLIAVSDIHGQYDLFVKLLQSNNVINNDYNWIFGTGHLVIVGDIFDRGSEVTETLWLVYRLEQQAELEGGKVHYLLGNHELMVLNNDLRYVNDKYIETAKLMGTTYNEIYSEKTFIGKWLRTKPVMVNINDILFVHAGISSEFVDNGFTVEKTNTLFTNNIVGYSKEETDENKSLSFLTGTTGPVWYRGYFRDTTMNEYKIDKILNHLDKKHIIVGHTSFQNIVSLYNGKIFGIDSSIKRGEYGEILIYKNGEFLKGNTKGDIFKL